jgi:glycosyltransferase involved in cell wall biosynthesis
MIKEKLGYIPKDQRKKIILISDDIRSQSGVGHIGREIIIKTSHHFNWVNIAGSVKHPEAGKKLDISQSTNEENDIDDSSVIMYPIDGYGTQDFIQKIIKLEKPDAILLITDPRYFTWLFAIENEIRNQIPIAYLNIWDNYPTPLFNLPYYESSDMLLSISKQTKLINKLVLEHGDVPYIDLDSLEQFVNVKSNKNPRILKQISHGLNTKYFFPIDENHEKYKDLQNFKKSLFNGKEYEFVLFFNSRNIRRKQIPDTLLAYKIFIDNYYGVDPKKCAFVLHTELVSEHGTDLGAVKELLLDSEKYNVIITNKIFSVTDMNLLYNSVDAQILLSSNEGWGLSLTEALLCGKPIIANVTGGMQDQMRFSDKNGKWFIPSKSLPSNHTGALQNHGIWAFPVFPSNRSIQGSPATPYIWDDRCNPADAALKINQLYTMTKEERKEIGLKGHEWATGEEAGFTSIHQAEKIIEAFEFLFKTWIPREKFELINTNTIKNKNLNHDLLY